MFFWFIGIGVLIFKYVFKDNKADLRYLITGLLVLDFLDILLSIEPIGKELKFITHSLIFSVFMMFLIMLFSKRGSKVRKNSLLFSIGLYLHLFLDFMWLDQAIFLYPLPSETIDIFNKTLLMVVAQELIGVTYLIYKLKNQSIREFIKNGII